MLKQQQPFKGLGFLLLLAIMLLFASRLPQKSGIITNQELMQAIDNGTITSATVRQNDPPPTGRIEMVMTDNSLKQANVSNVIEIQDLLDREWNYLHSGCSPERESFSCHNLTHYINGSSPGFSVYVNECQSRSRQRQCQDDEFWKKPCSSCKGCQ